MLYHYLWAAAATPVHAVPRAHAPTYRRHTPIERRRHVFFDHVTKRAIHGFTGIARYCARYRRTVVVTVLSSRAHLRSRLVFKRAELASRFQRPFLRVGRFPNPPSLLKTYESIPKLQPISVTRETPQGGRLTSLSKTIFSTTFLEIIVVLKNYWRGETLFFSKIGICKYHCCKYTPFLL